MGSTRRKLKRLLVLKYNDHDMGYGEDEASEPQVYSDSPNERLGGSKLSLLEHLQAGCLCLFLHLESLPLPAPHLNPEKHNWINVRQITLLYSIFGHFSPHHSHAVLMICKYKCLWNVQQRAWSQTGSPVPPPPLTFHLDKVIFLNRQRIGSHKSVTTHTAPWGPCSPLLRRDGSLTWCGCTSLGLQNNREQGLGLLRAEAFWWEGKLKPQDLKRAIKVMMGNVRPADTQLWLTYLAGGNKMLRLVIFHMTKV